MSGPHIADLIGAYRAGRDAAVAAVRLWGAPWDEHTYSDSCLKIDQIDVLGLMAQTGETFCCVPLGDSITTEGEGVDRLRTQSYLFVVAQRASDKTAEDVFFDYVEQWENRWTGRASFTYAVDGVDVEFLVSTAEAVPLFVETNEQGEVVGHASTRQLIFRVNACAY